MNRKEAGNISLPLYAVIGVALVVLFLGALFISKQYIVGTSSREVSTKTRQTPQQETVAEKKQKDLESKRKAAQQAQEAEAAKKAADEKAQQAAQAANPAPVAPTSPAPQAVASTGPEDTVMAVLGVLCLSYAIYAFARSRRALRERQHPSLT